MLLYLYILGLSRFQESDKLYMKNISILFMTNKTRKNKFCSADYNSNDGILTTIWGPSTWHLLHSISFNYPTKPSEKDKIHYRTFIQNLQHVLPCGKCRKNLLVNFKKLPLLKKHMESRSTFSKYVFDLHNVVNTMLHKSSGLTYNDVRDTYELYRARCITMKKKTELGCIEPRNGIKRKCVLSFVTE